VRHCFHHWIALSDGLIDRCGKPIGTDFSNTYAAGTLAWAGKPSDAYDPAITLQPRRPCSAAAMSHSTAGIIRHSSSPWL
jgi:hypothetical protein